MNNNNPIPNYHWICPNCSSKVDFISEISELFDPDDNNEASFNPVNGIFFHTIMCKCGKQWIISLSGMKNGFEEDEE